MGSAKSAWYSTLIVSAVGCTNASSTTLRVDTDAANAGAQDGGDAGALDRDPDAMDATDGSTNAFTLTSSVLENGGLFEAKHTCTADDVSPPLSWKNPPVGTKSFALLLIDLDDHVFGDPGPFVQWALFNIPQAFQALPENVGTGPMPSKVPGASQVRAWSAFGGAVGGNHYRGPCPSEVHRYELALFALDVELLEGFDTTKQPREIANRLDTHQNVLGVATLTAAYAPSL
jgi:Raf kinase inhibitor-like YbhB/YbcL family protein